MLWHLVRENKFLLKQVEEAQVELLSLTKMKKENNHFNQYDLLSFRYCRYI